MVKAHKSEPQLEVVEPDAPSDRPAVSAEDIIVYLASEADNKSDMRQTISRMIDNLADEATAFQHYIDKRASGFRQMANDTEQFGNDQMDRLSRRQASLRQLILCVDNASLPLPDLSNLFAKELPRKRGWFGGKK